MCVKLPKMGGYTHSVLNIFACHINLIQVDRSESSIYFISLGTMCWSLWCWSWGSVVWAHRIR
jgi:hypothetical protein